MMFLGGEILILINLNTTLTLVLSIFLFLLGTIIKNKIKLFDKLCIPSPVIGGILFCILNLFLRIFNICFITMDTSLMSFFICFFFSIVGIGISLSIVKKGGRDLILYWILCGILAFGQNILAVILSKVTNINPLLGLMCGTISMEGGHGVAAAFGATIEGMGVSYATSVGIAASTFGLTFAGLVGGPVGRFLIEKNNLKPNSNLANLTKKTYTKNLSINSNYPTFKIDAFSLLEQVFLILLCITLGEFVSNIIFKFTNTIIPVVTGCILVGVIFRNLNDQVKFVKLNSCILDLLSEVSLGIFLSMALMSIDLFKLSSLFGPIFIIVASQVIFIVLYAIFIIFNAFGRNLDAAIIASGLIGHGLGATPNALANMNSIGDVYGKSEKALLIVPIVAAFLLDVFTMPSIIFFINLLS